MKLMALLILGLFMTDFNSTQLQETDPIIGTWKMKINAPNGTDTGLLTFYDDEGKLKVSNDIGSYKVGSDGDNYTWQMTNKTPMGNMKFDVNAVLDGDTMSGTMEMKSGMAAGRTVDFTASRK